MTSTPAITVYQGDDWQFPFTYTAAGVPVDLTGFEPGGELLFGSSSIPLTVANHGATVVDATSGKFRLDVTRTDTAQIQSEYRNGGNRLHVFVIDSALEKTTLVVIPLNVVRP